MFPIGIENVSLLQVGAVSVYTPEVGTTLGDLQKDVDFLKLRYGLDEKGKAEGRLILRFVQSFLLNFLCEMKRSIPL